MKILIIQTAFIGDVVLATPLVEKLRHHYPEAQIDFLLRKGNESLLYQHPYIRKVMIFDKKNGKYRNLFKLISQIRAEKYDYVINAQRFFASGLMTALSGGKVTIGFDKNPMSFLFSKKVRHHISADAKGVHEVHRNLALISDITDAELVKPKLYPSEANSHKVRKDIVYICIAPASIWFTKQYPKERWIDFIRSVPETISIFLIGAKSDLELCNTIENQSKMQNPKSQILNFAGQLSFLESAALMKGALMNYVNDSAPLHFASAVNAPVTAIFCSTVPAFGFGPLSDTSFVVETKEQLSCRPCGLHGKKVCPLGHFDCSKIEKEELLSSILPLR